MRKYSKHNRCPKCGDQKADSKFEPAATKNNVLVLPERIVRNCKNCSYTWNEAPIDVKEVDNVK